MLSRAANGLLRGACLVAGRKLPAAAGARLQVPVATRSFVATRPVAWRAQEAGVGDRTWSLNSLGGVNSSGQVEWMDEMQRDERPPKPNKEEVITKYREEAAKLSTTSSAPVQWEDEIAFDGGVKRALDHLLLTVGEGNWSKYEEMCDKNITCFEPETGGYVAKGLAFHKFYFDLPGSGPEVKPNTTLADVHIRILAGGDSAVVCYVRLTQKMGTDGPETLRSNETRVFERNSGKWVCVHFHRTPV